MVIKDVPQVKKSLVDVVFMSEKRKNVLLLLQDGKKDMEFLLNNLKTTRAALLPQIKVMEEHHLVSQDKGSYESTTIGKIIVEKIKPLIDKIKILDIDVDYWGTHDLSFIPPHLLERIGELGECQTSTTNTIDIFNIHEGYIHSCIKSKFAYGYTKSFYPDIERIFSDMVARNVNTSIIIPPELLDKVKKEHSLCFGKLLRSRLFHLYVYPEELSLLSIAFNDYCCIIRLLKDNGFYDNTYVMCSGQNALNWVKELFNYYLENSLQVTESEFQLA